MNTARFSAEHVQQVQNIITSAQQQGLPADALTNKVYEGIAKNIDPNRIIQALKRVTSRYVYGYTLARKFTQKEKQVDELGSTITEGIAAGLSRSDAEKLVNSLQSRSRQMTRDEMYVLAEETMLTARDLSRQGVSSTTTTEVVSKAVNKGFSASEMQTMRNTFNAQGARGNRESLAKVYGSAIDQGVQAGDLASQGTGGRGFGGTQGSQDNNASGNAAGGNSGGKGNSGGG